MVHRRSDAEQERLAAALRANLARRKAQARQRQEGELRQRQEGEARERQEGHVPERQESGRSEPAAEPGAPGGVGEGDPADSAQSVQDGKSRGKQVR
jgi:hypothetical protein